MSVIAVESRRTRLLGRLRPHRALLIVAAAVLAGLGVAAVGSSTSVPPIAWLVAGPALVVLGFVVSRGPMVCLACFVLIDVLGLFSVSLVSAGTVQVRMIDIFWVALVGWMIVVRARDGVQPGRNVGQRALAVWLIALGISLVPVLVRTPGLVTDPVVGYVRLVQTFSLVWLLPYVVRRSKDAEQVLGILIFASAAEIVRAVVNAFATGAVSARLEAGNSANTEGLLAALLVVAALHSPVPRSRALRVSVFVIGLVGLVMARSLGATAAVVAALAIFGVRSAHDDGSRSRSSLLMPIRVIVLVVAGLLLASTLRPENLPSSSQFAQSTTAHRAVLASAGLDLFASNPIVGVGWQRSPELITAPAVTDRIRREFGSAINPQFIPAQGVPLSVHNLYVQVLAEGGLVAFLTLVAFLLMCASGIKRALVELRGTPDFRTVRACMVLLVVVAIWWNDNALYGLQPESVVAATLIGVLAATVFVPHRQPTDRVRAVTSGSTAARRPV